MTQSTEINFEYALQLQITKTRLFRYMRHQMHFFMLCVLQKMIVIFSVIILK